MTKSNVIEFPRNTQRPEPVHSKGPTEPLRNSVPCLDIVKDRVARDWDRGVRIAQLANNYKTKRPVIEAIVWERRARRIAVDAERRAA